MIQSLPSRVKPRTKIPQADFACSKCYNGAHKDRGQLDQAAPPRSVVRELQSRAEACLEASLMRGFRGHEREFTKKTRYGNPSIRPRSSTTFQEL